MAMTFLTDGDLQGVLDRLGALEQGGGGVAPSVRCIQKIHASHTDLFRDWIELTGFRARFHVATASVALVSLNVELIHRNLIPPSMPSNAVGYGIRMRRKSAATEAELATATEEYIPRAYAAGNIGSIEDHYATATIPALAVALTAGWHEFSVWGNSHSDAAPTTDGLIEVHHPSPDSDYNFMTIQIHEGATMVAL